MAACGGSARGEELHGATVNPALKAVYRHLKADDKKPEVALGVIMRKLTNRLNTRLCDN